MIVAICGQCSWLGGTDSLEFVEGVEEEVLEGLSDAMKGNKDASYLACPQCRSRDVFYKHLAGGDLPKPQFLPTVNLGAQGLGIGNVVLEEAPVPPADPEESSGEDSAPEDTGTTEQPVAVEPPAPVVQPAAPPGMTEMMAMFGAMMEKLLDGKKQDEAPPPPLQEEERIPPDPHSYQQWPPRGEGKQPVTDTDRNPFPFICQCDECDNSFRSKVEKATRCDKCTKKLVR